MPPPPFFSQKNKDKINALNNCLSRKLYMLTILIDVLAFIMLPKIVEKLIIRLFDFLSQQKFYFTTTNMYSSSLKVNCKKD